MSKKIVLTKKQTAELETLGAVLNQQQLADYFGFHKDTLQQIFKRDDEALRMYKKGRAKAIYDIADSLLTKARGGDTVSSIFFLKSQAGWSETSKGEAESAAPLVGIRLVG